MNWIDDSGRHRYLQEDCFLDTTTHTYIYIQRFVICYLLCSCGGASTIFTHQIVCSFPTHVSFPLFLISTCHIYIYMHCIYLYMVSICLFSLKNLEKQPAPLNTCSTRMCTSPMSKQVMSQRCVAMVSCYSAVASMRKLRITRGFGALERQHQQASARFGWQS